MELHEKKKASIHTGAGLFREQILRQLLHPGMGKVRRLRTHHTLTGASTWLVVSLSHWIGGAEGDRTLDLRIANATLSQLSYRPMTL
jgi:hypothetical protein